MKKLHPSVEESASKKQLRGIKLDLKDGGVSLPLNEIDLDHMAYLLNTSGASKLNNED